MKRFTIIFVVAGLLLAVAPPARADVDAQLAELQSEAIALGERAVQVDSFDAKAALMKEFKSLHDRLAERLRQMLQQSRFEDVLEASAGALEWREWPTDLEHAERVRFQLDRTKVLRINYRRRQLADGTCLYVLGSSFWQAQDDDRSRVDPPMYVIIVDEGIAEIEQLARFEDSSSAMGFGGMSPAFLGFVPGNDVRPSIAFLEGPHGNGSKTHLVLYCFDETTSKWNRRVVGEWWKAGEFDYSETTATLTITASVYDVAAKRSVRKDLTYKLGHELCDEGNELTPIG